MRRVGKYEKMRAKALMQTYITSLLCLVLCVGMFLGTSYAWFTSEVISEENQMYVGVLDVSLYHSTFAAGERGIYQVNEQNVKEWKSGEYAEITGTYKILNDDIKWEPGYTAVEQFKLVENGDLAFNYTLGINCEHVVVENDTLTEEQKIANAIAKHIDVWSCTGDAKAIDKLEGDFAEMTAEGWKKVGTLYEVITEGRTVFGGMMDHTTVNAEKVVDNQVVEVPAEAYHMIALHMDDEFDGIYKQATQTEPAETVQGETLNGITIKLVASQLPSEQDAFDNSYDAAQSGFLPVNDSTEMNTALSEGKTKILLADGEYRMPSNSTTANITISGSKNTVLDMTQGAYLDSAEGVTISGVTIKTGTGMAGGNGSDYAALYAKNVKYVNCTFVGPMRIGRDGAQFINCTFTELGNDYIWTYGNDVSFEGCTFNTEGKAILIYNDGGTEVAQVSVKNCTFNATQGAKAGDITNQNCAAIEVNNYGNGVNLVSEGNVVDTTKFSGVWRIKAYTTGNPQVIVNGVEYTSLALDGKKMTINNKEVTVIG